MHHASVSRSDRSTPIIIQKKIGVHESGHSVDIHSKVDLLTQKLDQILSIVRGQVPTFTPPHPAGSVLSLIQSNPFC